MASSATCGTCAPAALSKNLNSGLRFNAGKAARTASTGKSCDCPDGLSLFRTLWGLAGNLCSWPSGTQYTVLGDEPRHPITAPRPSSRALIRPRKLEYLLLFSRQADQTESGKMPVSLTNSKLIYETLKQCDIRLVSALPETWLVHLIRMTDDDPEMTLVRLAKEEEAVGISAGAYFAGVKSAMLMQNHGFLASINGIVSFAHLYKIPLLMLVSYRGSFGERDPWQTQGGNVTEPVLRALRIPYFFLDSIETVKKRIRDAQTLAESSLQPVAILLTRDLMWEE
jgi:sulfopyruvate decarboxylase subunit alpha